VNLKPLEPRKALSPSLLSLKAIALSVAFFFVGLFIGKSQRLTRENK